MSDNKNRVGVSVLKIVVYSVAVFLLAVFQSSVAPRFGFFGATPMYLIAFIAAAAFFDGENTGAAAGLGAGVCADALGGVGISVLPLFYTLLGWIIGRCVRRLGHENNRSVGEALLRWAVWLSASCGVGMIITTVCLFLSAGRIHILTALMKLLVPEAVGTFLFGYPFGIVFMLIYRKKRDK